MTSKLKSLKDKLSLKKHITLACLRDRMSDTYTAKERNTFIDRIVKVKKEIVQLEQEIAIQESRLCK